MDTLLSDRQRHDLHKSMLGYLHSAGFTKTFEQLRQEAPDLADFELDATATTNGLLVKKWTSVIKMQKKIMELESRLAQALEEFTNSNHLPSDGSKRARKEWLPSEPASRTLVGHRDKINAVSFHPHYSVLASASVDATVKIWDWETGDLERTLKGHAKAVTDCDFDSAGKVLVTSSNDLFIKLWNVVEDYLNFATLRGHEHSISSVRFLPGDTRVVSSSRDNTVRVWDVQTTHCIKVLRPHEEWIRSVRPSLDGRLLLTCSNDFTARITELESALVKAEMRDHDNFVECAVFVPAIATPAVRELVAMPANAQSSKVDSLAISFAMTGSRDKTIKLWDALRGRCLWTFIGHDGWVQALAFHPSGKHLLSVADDHTMRIWDLTTGRCLRKIEAHTPFTQCLAWGHVPATEGGTTGRIVNVVATGGTDELVKIWCP
ncbi:dynein regulator [Amylocystis lapponica]|nr:dynein regulator [Amylocystis lapponica]